MQGRLTTLRSPSTLRILQLGPPRQDDSPSAPRRQRARAQCAPRRLATARERHARSASYAPPTRAKRFAGPPASHPSLASRARTRPNHKRRRRPPTLAPSAPPRVGGPAFSAVERSYALKRLNQRWSRMRSLTRELGAGTRRRRRRARRACVRRGGSYSLSSLPTRERVKNAPMYFMCGTTFMSTLYQPGFPGTSSTVTCA